MKTNLVALCVVLIGVVVEARGAPGKKKNSIFGDPCVGTFKYLEVAYVCKHGKPASFAINGYTQRYGDCGGHDIKKMTNVNQNQCASECNRIQACKTFIWVERRNYCWIKNYACPKLTSTTQKLYHFYTKKATAKPASFAINGYTQRYGDCGGHDIKKMTNVNQNQCASECNRIPACKTFIWVERRNYCWIKNYACPRLTSTTQKLYHFYTKKAQTKPGHVQICEHKRGKITCPSGQVIAINYSNYGRTSRSPCSAGKRSNSISKTTCRRSAAKVTNGCNGKPSCDLFASNSVFGDPCVGTFKYLEVAYVCKPGKPASFAINGYTQRYGDCGGHDIKKMTNVNQNQCASECNRIPACKTFIWVERRNYCWIKNYACPRLTSTTQKLYHFYTKKAQTKPGNVQICEHKRGKITCPSGQVIAINYSNYGRTSRSPCSAGKRSNSISKTTCRRSAAKVTNGCNGKPSCDLFASNSVFGDPCVGTFKYLEVAYVCKPGKPASFAIKGYTQRYGDCVGHDIKKMTNVNRNQCASECNRIPACKTFIWVERRNYCWIKKYACPRLTSTTQKLYHFYTKKDPCNKPGHVQICEHKRGKITCPSGQVIAINYSNYGRTSRSPCSAGKRSNSISKTTCRRSAAKVTNGCNGKSSCDLFASNSVFGDPCVGTFKYLEVAYVCKPACRQGYIKIGSHCVPPCRSGFKRHGLRCLRVCSAGYERSGVRCLKKCARGYSRIGVRCLKNCPSGHRRIGVHCQKICQTGYQRIGVRCLKNCARGYERVGQRCLKRCQKGYKRIGLKCLKPCAKGYQRIGNHCLKPCPSHYRRVGYHCQKICPSGYRRVGSACLKPCAKGYQRVGRRCLKPCPSGYRRVGYSCLRICPRGYTRVGRNCLRICPNGYRRVGRSCLRICPNGYRRVGKGTCLRICPSGYRRIGRSCLKICPSGYRRVGRSCLKICPSGFRRVGRSCLKICASGYRRVGRSCLKICPRGFRSFGRSCLKICASGYRRVGESCLKICPSGYSRVGRSCLKTCASGYRRVGRSCLKICPNGYRRFGKSCLKVCQPGYSRVGRVCRKSCKEGYTRIGVYCMKNCADGYTRIGKVCRKDCKEGYRRFGSGICRKNCKEGYTRYGLGCVKNCKTGYTRIGSRCLKNCKEGYRRIGFHCVKNCASGYRLVGSKCIENCKSGYTLVGRSCLKSCKPDETRVGRECLKTCDKDSVRIGRTCVKNCQPGFRRVGLKCVKNCDKDYTLVGNKCLKNCQPGFRRIGKSCVKVCGDGFTRVGNTCLKDCAKGFSRVGKECLKVCKEDTEERVGKECLPICKEGFIRIGKTCLKKCEPGHKRVNGKCVKQCRPGFILVGNDCVIVCKEGYIRFDNECLKICEKGFTRVGKDCLQECKPGYSREGKECVPPACKKGSYWNGKACIACKTNYEWNGKKCVIINMDLTCKSSEKWGGDKCIKRCPNDATFWNGKSCVNRCSAAHQKWSGKGCVDRCLKAEQKWDGKGCVNRCPDAQKWDGKTCIDRCPGKENLWNTKWQRCFRQTGPTERGNAGGAPCMMPFRYKGKWHETCLQGDLELWCSVTADYDTDGSWGYCQKPCTAQDKSTKLPGDSWTFGGENFFCKEDGVVTAIPKAVSKTSEGNGGNAACVFPFRYKKKWYGECIVTSERPWCSTSTDYDVDSKWGYCPTPSKKGNCHFPFNYEGKTYHKCTEADSAGQPWCYTDAAFTKYEYCQ